MITGYISILIPLRPTQKTKTLELPEGIDDLIKRAKHLQEGDMRHEDLMNWKAKFCDDAIELLAQAAEEKE